MLLFQKCAALLSKGIYQGRQVPDPLKKEKVQEVSQMSVKHRKMSFVCRIVAYQSILREEFKLLYPKSLNEGALNLKNVIFSLLLLNYDIIYYEKITFYTHSHSHLCCKP